MRRMFRLGILALLITLTGCGKEPAAIDHLQMSGFGDLSDKRIGVLLGSCHDSYATKNQTGATILRYQNVNDMLTALNGDKIDAVYYDHVSLKEVFSSHPEFDLLAKNVFFAEIGAAFNQENDDLRMQFNAFLKEIRENGVYQDMIDRWMEKGITEMPDIPTPNTNGTLKVGVVSDGGMPSTFILNGKLTGFDIELPMRFAAYAGKEFIPVDLQFGAMLASLSTNKIDMTTCQMMINEEREKQVDFSDPYYESGISIIAKKEHIKPAATARFSKLEDIADKKVGIFSGTVHDAFMAEHYPKATVLRYDGTADMMLSLKTGKIDAAMFDLITAKLILKRNPDLVILSDDVFSMPLGVGFDKDNRILLDEFNRYLKDIRKDGTYDAMYKRWFIEDAEEAVMPPFTNPASDKKIIVAVSVEDLPYVAYMNNDFVGFDIDMIRTFAQRANYKLEIINIDFPGLIAALVSGKADMITDGIGISEERAKQVNFSDPYANFETAVVVAKKDMAGFGGEEPARVKKSFLKSVSDSFYSNIILEDRYLLILDGLKTTVVISFLAAIFGTLIGGLICFMKMSKRKLFSAFANIYISLIRGTPVLVLLMIIFYVIFAAVNINPVIVAVVAFGINFGAYVSEMFRTSIESVDKGQGEAGIASGFTKVQTFIYIILPQALRHVLPVYKGEFISLVKMTSIVGYIAVQDLTKASDIIRSRTFDAFFPLIMAAVIYILIAWLLTWALSYVEISVDPKRKHIKKVVEEKV
ncbi:MAG: ABC transporter permease subunit [Bacteroidota bacterium]